MFASQSDTVRIEVEIMTETERLMCHGIDIGGSLNRSTDAAFFAYQFAPGILVSECYGDFSLLDQVLAGKAKKDRDLN